MTRSHLLTLVVAAVAGAAVSHVVHPGRAGSATEPRHLQSLDSQKRLEVDVVGRAELEALAVQVLALRNEVAALRSERGSQSPASHDRAPNDSPTPVREGESSEEEWMKAREVAMTELQAEFSTEVRDGKWSSAMSSSIRQSADKDDIVKRALRDVDCRSTTCRVELVADGSVSFNEALTPFAMSLSASLPTIQFDHTTDTTGQKIVVLYLTRAHS